jgi:hypothetical protein
MEIQKFDKLWHDAIVHHTAMVKRACDARQNIRSLRKHAYTLAVIILALQKHHHNQFLAHAESEGKTIDEWLDDRFAPIESLGGDRRTILADIEAGMTEKEFINIGPAWRPRKRAKTRNAIPHVGIAEGAPPTQLTTEERLDHLEVENAALRSENRELRRDNAILLRDNEQLRKDFGRLERLVESRKRKIA